MKEFFASIFSPRADINKKRKAVLKLVFITAIALALLLCLLFTTLIISAIKNKMAADDGDDDGDIGDDSSGSYTTVSLTNSTSLHTGDLVLVNKSNLYTFAEEANLVSLKNPSGYGLGRGDGSMMLDADTLTAFENMNAELKKHVTDANLVISTAYRSAEDQTALNNGTPAGASDFHTGRTIELKDKSGDTTVPVDVGDKYKWLYEHAHEYGFIVRYPADTEEKSFSEITGVADFAYAFRYVGVAHATYMYEKNLCLEEYLDMLRRDHQFSGESVSPLKVGKYEIYYFAASTDITDVKVPSKYSYEISGDNMNGYIVTVNKAVKNK